MMTNYSERMFDETELYEQILRRATEQGMTQTLAALPFAKKMHEGQFRKGKEKIPFIYHPLLAATHALALGLDDDDLVAAALLHDVCEDCGVGPEELPVGEKVREAVRLLTKDPTVDYHDEVQKAKYFETLGGNEIAAMVKLLDRCSNVSGMTSGFTRERMDEYVRETENYMFPVLERVVREYPKYRDQAFLLRYHMLSVIQAIKYLA